MPVRISPGIRITSKNKPLIAQGVAKELEGYADNAKQEMRMTQSFLYQVGDKYRVLKVKDENRIMVNINKFIILNMLEAFIDRTIRESVNQILKQDGYFLKVEGLQKGTEYLKVWVGISGVLNDKSFDTLKAIQNGNNKAIFDLISKQIEKI